MRARPSRTPEMHALRMFGASAGAAIAARVNPTASMLAPARTISTHETGVEIPRKRSVSNVLRPTRPAPGISSRRTRFGTTGGAASTPGEGRTDVTAVGRVVNGRLALTARL